MNTSELINQIRAAIQSGDDFDTLLGEIVENDGTNAIVPLFLMMDFSEDQTDEMYAVTHAVESFPDDVYVKELVDAAEQMAQTSPNFQKFLVARTMNSDCCGAFWLTVRSASAEAKRVLLDVIRKVRNQYSKDAVISKNCDQTIVLLSESP